MADMKTLEDMKVKSLTVDNHQMVDYWKEHGHLSPYDEDNLMDMTIVLEGDNEEITITAKIKDINYA